MRIAHIIMSFFLHFSNKLFVSVSTLDKKKNPKWVLHKISRNPKF